MNYKRYIKETDFDVLSSSRKNIKELCEGREDSKM